MITLYSYVLRELLKVFALASVALTALLTLTIEGGIYIMIPYEGLDAAGIFRLLPWSLVIAGTLTMPVAALFAATIVYGRLAADNELLACRAAGINIHKLFRPSLLLAAFVFLFTFLFGNYVIPDSVGQINRFLRANLRDLSMKQLNQKGYLRKWGEGGQKYLLTAESADIPTEEMLAGFPREAGVSYLLVQGPVLLELNRSDEIVRFLSAAAGLCQFDTRTTPVKVTVHVRDATIYEGGRQAGHVVQQAVGPFETPLQIPTKKSWANLSTLLHWRAAPWEADEMRGKIRTYADASRRQAMRAALIEPWAAGQTLTFFDTAGRRYEISAADCQAAASGRPLLKDARVVVTPAAQQDEKILYEAAQAELSLSASFETIWLRVRLQQPVFESRAGEPDSRRQKTTLLLEDLQPPPEFQAKAEQAYAPAELLDPRTVPPEQEEEKKSFALLKKELLDFQRKVTALIHFRLGLTTSVLVMVLMGAILGVAFRGSQVLAAFGLSCIPFGVILIVMIMGYQLGGQENTAAASRGIIWGGLAAVALADWILLRAGVRR